MKRTIICLMVTLALSVSVAFAGTPLSYIQITKNHVRLQVGQSSTLYVQYEPKNTTDDKTVVWSSDKENIATVENGVVIAKSEGVATITAVCGKHEGVCHVRVIGKDGYVDATPMYNLLNGFRAEKTWQWKKGSKSKKYFNTNKKNRLKPLKRNAKLEKAAQTRAREITKKYSHKRPNGKKWYTAYPKMSLRGENLVVCSDPVRAFEGLKETHSKYKYQGHRRNMLNKGFNSVGIAGYRKNGEIYWVMSFGKK